MLQALVCSHGQILEKEDLMKTVWPDTFVEKANLRNLIAEIEEIRERL